MNNKNIENNIPSITSLHQERVVKQNSKIDIFNIVLNKCIEKIVYTNRHTDKTFIIFEVPKILIGYPGYDMKSCILFLINRLSGSSYLVEFIEPFYLYIDWGSQKQIKPSKKVNSNYDKLQSQTKALLHKFPNTSKVEYVYEDMYKGNVSSKKNKKNKRK